MSASYVIPSDVSLKTSLQMIYGEEPEVEQLEDADFTPSHVADYVDEGGDLVARCFCDLGGAASLACALSLIPIPTAEDMVSTGALSEIAAENLYEVMNIFSSLFMNDQSGHLRLTAVVASESGALVTAKSAMRSAEYKISGVKYPGVQVSFCAV